MGLTPSSFRRRPSAGKIFVCWLKYFCLLLAVVVLGYVAWVRVDALAFQAYQSWRLDQMQQGKPATVTLFLKQWIPIPWERDATEPAQTTPVEPTANSAGPAADSTAPASAGPPPSLRTESERSTPSRPAARPPANDGTLVGRLQIPRLGLSAIVMEGISDQTLRVAVGHLPGTPLPGQPGNVALSAHRDTFFRDLRNIKPGDIITMSTVSGDVYQYRVAAMSVVPPDNTKILDAYSGPGINLITCFPFHYIGPAPKRIVVHADETGVSVVSQARRPASFQGRPQSANGAASN